MSRKEYKDMEDFFRQAPKKLKRDVKFYIQDLGYGTLHPDGSSLSAHIWESNHIEVSQNICADLIKHWSKPKD